MSSQAQILANQANAQKSCGPKTETGKESSSQNRTIHGLSDPGNSFNLQSYENEEEFNAFKLRLYQEQNPQDETECILVRRMIESEWLRRRAIFLQTLCQDNDGFLCQEKHFALYLRYQSMHERGFYKALNELQKLRNEKRKEQIGFESEKRAAAAENRAVESLNLKKQEFELKKQRAARLDQTKKSKKQTATPAPNPETSPGGLEMAA
jgi:hypothetical protein